MKNSFVSMKKIFLAAIALIALSQCTVEEIVPAQIDRSPAASESLTAAATGSLTISGVYTIYESIKDCKTCTFIIPANLTEIDGLELNLKAGSVICLNKAIQYGDLNFTNLEGTEESPIRIGTSEIK